MAEIEFGISSKGKETILYKGYEYIKERDNKPGTTSWRCRFHQSFRCKARLITNGDVLVIEKQANHTHDGNYTDSLARKAVGKMKNQMANVLVTPTTALTSVISGLPDEILVGLPKKRSLTQTLLREESRVAIARNLDPIPALPTDRSFHIPFQYSEMILFDSGEGEDRIILIGCRDLLNGVSMANLWVADGTFKVVPEVFFLIYTIHFHFSDGMNPVGIYCLLPNKTSQTYTRLLTHLRSLIPNASPQKILVDFERAAMNSFADAFSTAFITGYYFHLCQSVLRKVNDLGLKGLNESDEGIKKFVRSLPALAFVPPNDVFEAFDILADSQPLNIDGLDELVSFFEHTYIRGRRIRVRDQQFQPPMFQIECWNRYSAGACGIARTTNSVEGWHFALQSLFSCHHPTIWKFFDGLKKDIQQQKITFSKVLLV